MIIIGIQVLLLIMFMIFANQKSKTMQLVAGLLSLLLFGVHIYYAYIMVSYIMQLQKDNCSCLNTAFKTTFMIYTIVRVIMSVLAIIGLFILIKLRNATQMSADELAELNKTITKIKSSKK
jgi:TRAP-type C4-dicarboxylate transport system permease small subunit